MSQADEVGGEGKPYFDFPGLDGGRVEDVVTGIFIVDARRWIVADDNVARHRISGEEVEREAQRLFVLCHGIPLQLEGDTQMANVGECLLGGGGGCLHKLQPTGVAVIPGARKRNVVVERIPGEIVAQACPELPVGRHVPAHQERKLQREAVFAVVWRESVAKVQRGSGRDAKGQGDICLARLAGVGKGVALLGLPAECQTKEDENDCNAFHAM